MKLITAMVRPGKLDDVMRAATDAGCWSWQMTRSDGVAETNW